MECVCLRWRVVGWLVFGLVVASPVWAQSLVNGGVVGGVIAVSGEQDSYTFSASVGQSIELRVADLSGTSTFGPSVTLYNPSGSFITFGQGQNVGGVFHQALATGTYTVVVADGSTTHTGIGSYNLYFIRAPGANEGGELENGGVNPGAIDLGDLDSYTFAANAGESIELRVADLSGTFFSPVVTLYGPSGAYITAGLGLNVGRIEVQLTTSGTYTVEVADGSTTREGIGGYNLYFTRAPGANEGGRLFDGVTRLDAIDLGDLDSYTFTASAGQFAQIMVTDTSGGVFFPRVMLYGPSGGFITFGAGAVTGAIAYTIPAGAGGLYTLVVEDASTNGDSTGTYSLVLTGAGGGQPVNTLPLGGLGVLVVLLSGLAVRQQRPAVGCRVTPSGP